MRRTLILALVVAGLWTPACLGQTGSITLNPVMSKGPATAPVTIVEFSDYQ